MDHQFFNKTLWGLLLICAGVLFLLDQTGAIDIDVGTIFSVYWPVILIFLGLRGIFIQRKLEYGWGGSYIWNVFLTLLGGYFLLRNLKVDFLEELNLWQFIVPAVLIFTGINMLGRGSGSKYAERKAAMKEQYRQEKEAYKEQLRQEKLHYKEQKYKEKMERKFNAKPEDPCYGNVHSEEEPDPVYDPNYSRKIEQDLDQAFHERVVKKLADDPFPLVSQVTEESNKAVPPPPPPPPKQENHEHFRKAGWEHYSHKGRVVERSNFIGDIHLGHDYWELEPTNVSHFIGDTIIDLTKAHIPYGETKITVSSFIGDVKVFVPNDIQVEVSVTASAFIGDMKVLDRHEGGLFRHMKHDTPHYVEAEKKIQLTVSMFIGDVFVKRVG